MKYSTNNPPLKCMMTNSTCYKGTSTMTIKGILWHSTGANNPNLSRYVQPSSNDANYNKLIKQIGKNSYGTDWNHIYVEAGLNAWIGKLANGTVTTVQTMPWNYRPWGCGSGKNGSCNNGWIQFEICEDALTDSNYFNKVYVEACELTAYLCKLYNIDPKGSTTLNGVKVPTILCHYDSYFLGLGSNHGDVLHWFPKFGKNMETVRNDVAKLMGSTPIQSTPEADSSKKVNYTVITTDDLNCRKGPSTSYNIIKTYTEGTQLTITKEQNNWGYTGLGWVSLAYTKKVTTTAPTKELPYLVKVTADILNIRSGPSTNYKIVGTIKKGEVYTIVKKSGDWGYLKSGAGWIHLGYTQKYVKK